MDTRTRRRYRRIAHHLSPVVAIGAGDVTDAVVNETNRALTDHELIKVKIHEESRQARAHAIEQLAKRCNALIVQKIGKTAVLYRSNPDADPKLSNLDRFA
jgi:RNA-binding protein